MSVLSTKVETPGSLKVKFSFQKKRKEGEPTGAPGKVQPSQLGPPSAEDEERFSLISLSEVTLVHLPMLVCHLQVGSNVYQTRGWES